MASKRSRAAFEADLQRQQSPYVFYGTPLPPVDPEVRDDGSYVPVWKQEVRDERGRKRLHGAFTGGFSAGYFNTVGSKEGWAPSNFVSSRTNRHHDQTRGAQQRPEDFMDEEDLAEAAEAQKLQTVDSFAGLGSTDQAVGAVDPLVGLVRPNGITMGVKLLQRMGWRQGQGVGPKVRREARLDDADEPIGAAKEGTHLFAPDNSRMITFTRKNDYKGLGLEEAARETGASRSDGADEHEVDKLDDPYPSALNRSSQQKTKKVPRRGGFGVGILNDTGSDEEDPYEMGPRISYNRVIGPEKKAKKVGGIQARSGSANPLLGTKPVFVSKRDAHRRSTNEVRRCHDGRPPLDGFVLANTPISLEQTSKYTPPTIPDGWQSSRSPQPQSSKPSKYQSVSDAAKSNTLDSKTRANLLGEAPLPGKSVFDYLSSSARDRIVSASGRSDLPAALGESPPETHRKSEADKWKALWDMVPSLDKSIAAAALGRGLSGWMPYAEDEKKRSRYRLFLELRAGLREVLPERAPGMSVDKWVQEMQEFAQAAQVFKPISGLMASRFTTSSSTFTQPSTEEVSSSSDTLLRSPAEKPEDPAEAAASLGMYGPMTRSLLQFYPTRLVCKRFNVKPPAHVQLDPRTGPVGETATSTIPDARLDIVSKSVLDDMLQHASLSPARYNTSSTNTGGTSLPLAVQKEVFVDVERNDALEAERPGDAVFKAIFGSDNEDEDDTGTAMG